MSHEIKELEGKETPSLADAMRASGIETPRGKGQPAKGRQLGRAHTGPLTNQQFGELIDTYDKLEGGLTNRTLITAVIKAAEKDATVSVIDADTLGKFYHLYTNLPIEAMNIVLRSIALERKLGSVPIPKRTGMRALAEVLYPPADEKWSAVWRMSGNATIIEKRMGKAKTDYEGRVKAEAMLIEAEKAKVAYAKQVADEKAKLAEQLAAGTITQEQHDAAVHAIDNPAKAKEMPESPKSARAVFMALWKLASTEATFRHDGATGAVITVQSERTFIESAFNSMGYAENVTQWIADIAKGK